MLKNKKFEADLQYIADKCLAYGFYGKFVPGLSGEKLRKMFDKCEEAGWLFLSMAFSQLPSGAAIVIQTKKQADCEAGGRLPGDWKYACKVWNLGGGREGTCRSNDKIQAVTAAIADAFRKTPRIPGVVKKEDLDCFVRIFRGSLVDFMEHECSMKIDDRKALEQ